VVNVVRPLVRPAAQAVVLAPARPAWKAGFRVAFATLTPVLVGSALGLSETSWLMLGGFSAALADKGGAYRTRAATMGAFALTGALAVVLGSLAGHHPRLAVAAAFLGTAGFALFRVYGAGATAVGLLATTVFLISLAQPAPTSALALERAAALVSGSAWAMLLALVLWPLRVYRPGRLAIGAVYRETADFVADLARQAEEGGARGWGGAATPHHARVRHALEEARATLAAIRRARQGESGRGERLLVMLQSADRVFPSLVALAFVLEGIARDRAVPREVVTALRALDSVLRECARVAETETEARVARPPVWEPAAWRAEMEVLAERTTSAEGHAQVAHAAALLDRLHEYAEVSAGTAEGIDGEDGASIRRLEGADPLSVDADRPPLLAPLRSALSPGSLVMRHALRVGTAAAAATALTAAFGIQRGYWVTLTAVIVLQPYTGATMVKGLQRVVGTVLGGILAAFVAAAVHSSTGIMAAIFVTAVVGVALQPLNYAAYATFLTPTFVLLAEVGAGDWHLVHVRVINTLLGGALALVGAFVLWPSPESTRLPTLAATAIRRSGAYLDRALGSLLGDDVAGLADARRDAGLAATNAEASFQRLLSESARRDDELEGWMALLAYVRRLTGAATALATARRLDLPVRHDVLQAFRADAASAVAAVADAVSAERAPAPIPDLRADAEAVPLLRTHLERAARRIAVLHAAAARLHPSSATDVEAETVAEAATTP
jgi:uncharacterized membrane protein YccC